MEQQNLNDLLDGKVELVCKNIRDAALTGDELVAVYEAESDGKDRTGVIEVLESLIQANITADRNTPTEKPAPTDVDWQHPDYEGAMDAVQAMWRNKHLKNK